VKQRSKKAFIEFLCFILVIRLNVREIQKRLKGLLINELVENKEKAKNNASKKKLTK
jgi:hypothetical protein